HLDFIVFDLRVHYQGFHSPLIFSCITKLDGVFMVRKYLSESSNPHSPWAWLRKCIFHRSTKIQFGYITSPSATARSTLIAKASKVISLISVYISESWNI